LLITASGSVENKLLTTSLPDTGNTCQCSKLIWRGFSSSFIDYRSTSSYLLKTSRL